MTYNLLACGSQGKWPKASELSCGNAFAGPHQGLQNLSAREEDGEKTKSKEQKTRQSGRRRMTESVVGDSGQPMPQPLQADGTEDGPVRYGPHHMVLT